MRPFGILPCFAWSLAVGLVAMLLISDLSLALTAVPGVWMGWGVSWLQHRNDP